MVLTYTFFYRKLMSRDINVFPGRHETRPEDIPPQYTYDTGNRHFELIEHTPVGDRTAVKGRDNTAGTSAELTLGELNLSCKYKKWFPNGITLTYNTDTLKWRANWNTDHWILRNAADEQIARFDRKPYNLEAPGYLEISQDIDSAYCDLVVVTCEMLHQHIKTLEMVAVA